MTKFRSLLVVLVCGTIVATACGSDSKSSSTTAAGAASATTAAGAGTETTPAASDSLDVILSRVRRKLGRPEEGCAVRTVRGEGFIFETTA